MAFAHHHTTCSVLQNPHFWSPSPFTCSTFLIISQAPSPSPNFRCPLPPSLPQLPLFTRITSHFLPVSLPLTSFFVFYLASSSFTTHYTFLISSVCLSSISQSLVASSPLFLFLSFNFTVAFPSHHPPFPSTSSSCSPPCSRPGLFLLIRLSVTPTRSRTHAHARRETDNDIALPLWLALANCYFSHP